MSRLRSWRIGVKFVAGSTRRLANAQRRTDEQVVGLTFAVERLVEEPASAVAFARARRVDGEVAIQDSMSFQKNNHRCTRPLLALFCP